MSFEYKRERKLQDRKNDSIKAAKRYPNRVPIIVEIHPQSKTELQLDKRKYLVPKEMSVSTFIYVLRNRITKFKLNPEQAIYVFVNNILPTVSKPLGELYREHQDEDGFLYMHVSMENTFG